MEYDNEVFIPIPGVVPPSIEAFAGCDPLEPFTAEQTAAQNARFEWELNQMDILADYPLIGVAGSAANLRFARMYRALGGTPVDPVAVAQLVMVYPPKEAPEN